MIQWYNDRNWESYKSNCVSIKMMTKKKAACDIDDNGAVDLDDIKVMVYICSVLRRRSKNVGWSYKAGRRRYWQCACVLATYVCQHQ